MTRRICLVTTGQPSTNPRLVKEADALTALGHHVHVIGAHWAAWADRTDAALLATRRWSADIIDWRRATAPARFWKTRVRHAVARAVAARWMGGRGRIGTSAPGRLTPELTTAARAWPADLYVAHNLGALPAAAAAARRHGARLGFDAEDHHSGQVTPDDPAWRIARAVEDRYLPACDYVTASSPRIAAAYAWLCRREPVVVLNVYALSDRPAAPVPPGDGPLRLYWFSQTVGPRRGLEEAVSAMGQLPAGSVELHVRGAWAPGYAEVLAAAARAAGVSDSQIVRYDPAPPADMVRLAAPFDVGLALEPTVPANADAALSNKLFAYLLAGVPVIATDTAAHRALAPALDDAMTVVPAGQAGALAAAIRRWADDRPNLAAARRVAWQRGETRYNWECEQPRYLAAVAAAFDGGDALRAAASRLDAGARHAQRPNRVTS